MFKVHVGNISYKTPQQTLAKLFSVYGLVDEVIFVADEETGRPRGFAFVLMPHEAQALAAIAALHDRPVNGRRLVVTEAGKKPGRQLEGVEAAARDGTSRRPMRGARVNSRPGRSARRNR